MTVSAAPHPFVPRIVAWEVTRRCALACTHCRGAARDIAYANELTTHECHMVIDRLAAWGTPMLILTGGEPMSRSDIYDLAAYAVARGLRVVLAPCGHLITPDTARQMVDAGIAGISISLDGAHAATHDAFRGVDGAFATACRAIGLARDVGLAVQVNTTVARHNVEELPAVLALAERLGVRTLDLFFLVPTGRGGAVRDLALNPIECERVLNWVADTAAHAAIRVKTTCAPQYVRILHQREKQCVSHAQRVVNASVSVRGRLPVPASRRDPCSSAGSTRADATGCMAGKGFLFISHTGMLQPCGFLPVECGDLRHTCFDVRAAYEASSVLKDLAHTDALRGACGACAFRHACGGCRARAFAASGDYRGQDPSCAYAQGAHAS